MARREVKFLDPSQIPRERKQVTKYGSIVKKRKWRDRTGLDTPVVANVNDARATEGLGLDLRCWPAGRRIFFLPITFFF